MQEKGPGTGEKRGDASYAVPITSDHELIYEWVTDRDARGNARINHLDLLVIRRAKK